ncbi:hypothetical protein EYF80_018650 [Liparis tanakae]|uniref:Uncharacterized protein n=1 Tax=Liparis tanakae TaxID=230148 RepID=A0A4Z2HZZ8_9TELE|nr:hypothetical protein EYF80_018650 [Liparis tanakae]
MFVEDDCGGTPHKESTTVFLEGGGVKPEARQSLCNTTVRLAGSGETLERLRFLRLALASLPSERADVPAVREASPGVRPEPPAALPRGREYDWFAPSELVYVSLELTKLG